jgi:natural product biosynthesis luciferase-like monooxygenase protein/amino acid adenylation domain-containing protein/FkbM family methyltransferase
MDPLSHRLARLTPRQLSVLILRVRGQGTGTRAGGIPRRPGTEPVPLSFAQQRLWFVQHLDPANAAYNMVVATRVDGALDAGALVRALDAVVARHDALRTVVHVRDGEPVQQVVPDMRVVMEIETLPGRDPAAGDADAERRARREAERPFDLAAGPLLRALLLRVGPERHVLVLTLHHVIADGWSRGVIVRELSAAYTAFAAGREPVLPTLPVQYPDYAAWQRERMQGALLARQLGYWTAKLAGAPPALVLPTDHPRPPLQSFAGRTHRFRVPRDTADALRALAREADATLFMVLLAGFKALLARSTGQTDVVAGTPAANRGRAEVQGLVGFFANTLALRTELAGDPTFREVVRRVRATALDAYAHEELPFERLVEALQPERSLARNPVFQVMFLLDEAPLRAFRLPGVEMTPLEVDPGTSMVDLTLAMERADDGLAGRLEYATALFDADTAARMAEHLCVLLRAAAADPGTPLSALPLLSGAERAAIAQWNATERGYPAGVLVHDLFAAQTARTPDVSALVFRGSATTYAELDARANRLANHLRGLGVETETRVGVCLERTPALVVALLAIHKAGGAYVPLDPAYPRERLGWMIEDAGARLVLTTDALADRLPASARAIPIDTLRDRIASESARAPRAFVHPENLSHVIFTSGSTGRPKGVMIRHASVGVLLHWMRETVSDDDRAAVLASTSINFDVSVAEIFGTLCWGGTIVLVENALALPDVADQGIRYASMVPTAAAELLRAGAIPASVRTLFLGGEPLPNDLAQALYALGTVTTVGNLYGPTEDTTYSTCSVVGRGADRVRVGKPVANTRAHVLDDGLRPLPVGIAGELYLAGGGLARGYAARPGMTAERFVPDPFGAPGSRMYWVMDRVRWTESGELEYLGRTDFQVKVRGFRIELGEIEVALRAHPAIQDAVALVREDAPGDRRIVAYFVAEEGRQAPAAAEARAWLKARLPEYMVPGAFVVLDALPRTPNGKLDRAALPAPERAGDAGAYLAPRTAEEEIVAGIFADVLDATGVGATDDFFARGGHSLLAARVVSRVRQSFGVDLPLRALFEAPTPAELALRIAMLRGDAAPAEETPLVPVDRSGPLPLSFAQRRMWWAHHLQGAPESYNLSVGLRLAGALDAEALRRALEGVVARHEALRTRFAEVDGQPVQIVEPAAPFELPVIDLSPVAPAGREARVARYAEEDAARPFDLGRAPLVRATLLRLDGAEHVLLASIHHIAADGWSLALFTDELRAHYAAARAGISADLPSLALQYGDYAVWQRSRENDPGIRRQPAFWKDALAGAPAATELPADRPRAPVQRFRGASFEVRLPAPLAERLRAVARAEGCTLYMVLLAGFGAWLRRYTGQDDLVVGSPVAGRDHPALEPLIGCFINVVPLRLRIDGADDFRQLLARVRETALDAFGNGGVSFDQVVEEAGVAREASRNPLVQVLFALQNTPPATVSLTGLEVRPLDAAARTARYDLSVYAREEADGGVAALVEYDTDLYDRATAERWMRHYARLLESLTAGPARPAGRAEMLDGAERARLLAACGGADVPLDPDDTLVARFAAQARRTPGAPALVAGGETVSYAELDARANRLAHRLRAAGIGPEARVGLLLDRSASMVAALLGVLKAGGAYVPLDPAYPADRIRFMAGDAGLALVLADAEPARRFPGLGVPVLPPCGGDEGWADTAPAGTIHGDSAAYVIYTSGSTGRPKGVVVQHRNVAAFCTAMDAAVGTGPGDTWLAVTSISFDISVLEILWTLSRGVRVVLHGERPRAVPAVSAVSALPAVPAAGTTDFSLFFFSSSESARTENKYRLLMEGARYADRNGFHAVWTPERHFHDFGGLYPNPAVTGAAVAAVTERVKIRAGSVVLPLQDTLRVAEEWSVVDNLSGGRVEVSFASGWHANDFVLRPENFETRRDVLFSGMDEVRALWRGEKVTRVNGKGAPVQVGTLPRPVQPELPVWITAAGSPDTFRRAGAAGAHLLTHLLGQSVADLESRIRVYRDARREAGLDPEAGRVALMLHTYVHEDADHVRATVRGPFREYLRTSFDLVLQLAPGAGFDPAHLSADDVEAMLDVAFERYYGSSGLMGTPEQCVEMVRRLRAIGVDEIACLADFGVDEDLVLQGLDALAEVMRRSREAPAERGEDDGRDGDADGAMEGGTVAELVRAHGVTHLQCTPSLAGVLAADPDARGALAGLVCILVGGEALSAPLAQALREASPGRVLNLYGPTETTVWSTVHPVDGAAGPVPIGRPVANTGTYVVDGLAQPVPAGVAGELLIGGAGVVRGYLGRPALTAERFVPDPFGPAEGGRLYRTGDLARRRDDGTLEFLGRMDQQVKVRGHRVEPGEVEAALAAHPAVRESVVVARADGTGEHRLVAYVTPAASTAAPAIPAVRVQPLGAQERERILAGLPRYTLPGGAVIASQQDSTTRELFTEIFEQGVYLRHGLTLRDGARVVDVGANIGMFTVFAHSAARGVRTWSFEPIPDTFARLHANAALAGGADARVFNTGVAHEEGMATFVHYPHSSGLSGRYADVERDRGATRAVIEGWMHRQAAAGGAADGAATLAPAEVDAFLDERFQAVELHCPLRTLSGVIRDEGIDRIDLLKVDVEKSEYDVLLGIDDEHWPLVRQIAMEVDTEALLQKVTALLDRHGFAHAVDRHVTIREGAPGAGGEHVYMLYARRPQDGALAAAPAAAPPSARELRRWLGDRLPDYMVPSLFVPLDALPRTPNGKVDRGSLPAPTAAAPAPEAEYVPPGNDREALIAGVWREVLGVERVGTRDNFFELGGTSVRLASVHRLLGERLQQPVTVVDLFRHPTVAGLAEFLAGKGGGDAAAKGAAQDRGERQRQAEQARQRRPGRPGR